MFYVQAGCANGFLVVPDFAVFTYKCTNPYRPEYDSGLIYNDADIAVKWPTGIDEIILSAKDKQLIPYCKKAIMTFSQ